jgi:hypothetical protein
MLVPASGVLAADPPDKPGKTETSSSSHANATDGVDFFAAMSSGDLDVKFIPRDSRRAQVLIKNTTDQPLSVKLPEAFAALPVLAQANGVGGNAGGNRTTGTGNTNNKNQSVGGGMGGGYGGGGMAGGAFSVPPERVVKLQVAVVCLEYGKPDPNPHVPYTIVPVEKYTSDGEVQEVCRLLGDAKVDQRTAQIAAWHLANHMSWDDLADLKVFPHFPQYTRLVFSADEIHEAMGIVDQAIKLADARKPSGTASGTAASSEKSSSASAGISSDGAAR